MAEETKTANRIIIAVEMDGKLYQVGMSDIKRRAVKNFLRKIFDGPIPVSDEEMLVKIETNKG